MMSMGSKIKSARISRGWVQRELAEKISVEPGTISRWENDEVEPEPRNLVALANVFGKNPEWFAIDIISDELSEIKARLNAIEAGPTTLTNDLEIQKLRKENEQLQQKINSLPEEFWKVWVGVRPRLKHAFLYFVLGRDEDLSGLSESFRKTLKKIRQDVAR